MAERRVNCVAECPHEEKIADVYEKVITGNGDLALTEKVRKLEDKMGEVLPDLKKLVAASERAEGERKSDIAFHNQRDQEIKDALAVAGQHQNRWMVVLTALMLIVTIFSIYHH